MEEQTVERLLGKRDALLIVGILIGLVVVKWLGGSLPVVSSAWLGFCVGGTIVIYLRARRKIARLQGEAENAKERIKNGTADAEVLSASLNTNLKNQFDRIKSKNDLTKDDMIVLEKVETATRENRLDLYLQPIVGLKDTQVHHYEAFSRLRDEHGHLLRPGDYLDTVERANHIGFIDNIILLRSVQALRDLPDQAKGASVFCNISPATLYDQNFFTLFTQYLDANADLANKLVFEFTYPAITLVDPTIGKSLEAISERGFSFSIDHIHRFQMDFSAFRKLNVRYVKVAANMLTNVRQQGSEAQERFEKFCTQLKQSNIILIGEKIEQESDRTLIQEMGLTLGQGNYFGRPRPADVYLSPEKPAFKKAS